VFLTTYRIVLALGSRSGEQRVKSPARATKSTASPGTLPRVERSAG